MPVFSSPWVFPFLYLPMGTVHIGPSFFFMRIPGSFVFSAMVMVCPK
jgi:hypothetical protein